MFTYMVNIFIMIILIFIVIITIFISIIIIIIIITTTIIIWEFYNLGSQSLSSYQKHRQVLTS